MRLPIFPAASNWGHKLLEVQILSYQMEEGQSQRQPGHVSEGNPTMKLSPNPENVAVHPTSPNWSGRTLWEGLSATRPPFLPGYYIPVIQNCRFLECVNWTLWFIGTYQVNSAGKKNFISRVAGKHRRVIRQFLSQRLRVLSWVTSFCLQFTSPTGLFPPKTNKVKLSVCSRRHCYLEFPVSL